MISAGYRKTDTGSGTTPFFPAAGASNYANGVVENVNVNGLYWSSSSFSTRAYDLYCFYNGVFSNNISTDRLYAFPIRCVLE
jgi:hypothetical protein